MKLRYSLPMSAFLSMTASAQAFAQFRCDCTSVVDSCQADVAVQGSSVEITTDQRQCARVDYFLDGQPLVSLVVDGRGRQDFTPRSEPPRVLVQSCQVCRDTLAGATNSSAAAARPPAPSPSAEGSPADDAGLRALIEVPPAYPADAAARGVTGRVDVAVTIGPGGDVQDASVTAAEPPNVFDQAALAAVRRWRYPADPNREAATVTERVEFSSRAAASVTPRSGEAAAMRRSSNGARNQCVREGSVFNYGEVIEVGLLNACGAPIMVYGCAAGTGRYRGQWVCTTSEQQQNVLAPTNDDRIGATMSIDTETGLLPLTFTDRFFLSRAPNSEYWWIACAIEDLECRTAARLWSRSIDKQLTGVDPQGRSSLPVARSY